MNLKILLTGITDIIQIHSPIPKVKRMAKKRRAEAASHLTGSPYKAMLLAKPAKKTKPQKKPKVTRQKNQQNDTDDEEDWPCLICGESFHNSRSREKWIECVSCKKWAHYECTEQTGCSFICPNCNSDDDAN